MEKPARSAGNPQLFATQRAEAYRTLFGADPIRLFAHDAFRKPEFGGRIDVHIYELTYQRDRGQVQVAVTSGLSDYRMVRPGDPTPRRREIIQYFRDCSTGDAVRLHDMAWLPLAQGFCLDFFETVGSHPRFETSWPNSLFIPSLVKPHANFKLELDGDEMQLLWHVPLSHPELEFKVKHGVKALLGRMQERDLPWIFDEKTRVSLI